MYSVTVLDPRSLKSQCCQGHALSSGCKEDLFLAASRFLWLLAHPDIWQHHSNVCLHGHIASSSVRHLCISVCSPSASLSRLLVVDQDSLRLSRINSCSSDLYLNLIVFPYKMIVTGSGIRTCTDVLGGHLSTH